MVRDYIHVSDLAAAHVAALARLEAGGASGRWNLGTGNGVSCGRCSTPWAEWWVGRSPSRKRRGATEIRRRSSARAQRARADLGWAPVVSDLDRIVRDAYAFHRRAAERP